MSWKELVCLFVAVTGVVLFLYGSNYYNAIVGWVGAYLIIGGFLSEITLKVYVSVKRKKDAD